MLRRRPDLLEPPKRMPKPSRRANDRERRGEKGAVEAQSAPDYSRSCTAVPSTVSRPPSPSVETFATFTKLSPPR